MGSYLTNILIALDQVLTALIGGFPDESLSSYAYRMDIQGAQAGKITRPLIDAVFFWDDEHCRKSWEAERERRQMPPELR